jgi:hypothetical protein
VAATAAIIMAQVTLVNTVVTLPAILARAITTPALPIVVVAQFAATDQLKWAKLVMTAEVMAHAAIAILAATDMKPLAMSVAMETKQVARVVMITTLLTAMAAIQAARLKSAMVSVAVSMQGAMAAHVYATSTCSTM